MKVKKLIQALIKEEMDPRRPKDKAFDLAQQLSKLSPEDREKVAMIQQMISKEKMDKDDYGRSISGKDKSTFVDPEDLMPAARAKKLAGLKEMSAELGYLGEKKSIEDQLKIARAAFKKAEMNGDIRGQELALAAIEMLKNKKQ